MTKKQQPEQQTLEGTVSPVNEKLNRLVHRHVVLREERTVGTKTLSDQMAALRDKMRAVMVGEGMELYRNGTTRIKIEQGKVSCTDRAKDIDVE